MRKKSALSRAKNLPYSRKTTVRISRILEKHYNDHISDEAINNTYCRR